MLDIYQFKQKATNQRNFNNGYQMEGEAEHALLKAWLLNAADNLPIKIQGKHV